MTILETHVSISKLAFNLLTSSNIGTSVVLETDIANPPTYRARAADGSWATNTMAGVEMLAFLQNRDNDPVAAEQSLLQDKKSVLESNMVMLQSRLDTVNAKITPNE